MIPILVKRKGVWNVIEQEMAGIIRFILTNTGEITPYYWNVPEHFCVPAVYFPVTEIDTGGESFRTFYMDFVWYIKLIDRTEQGAYALGLAAVAAIRAARNRVPLIAKDGSVVTGAFLRLDDPRLKVLDDGAAQLTLSFRSRRPYQDAEAVRAQVFNMDLVTKAAGRKEDNHGE